MRFTTKALLAAALAAAVTAPALGGTPPDPRNIVAILDGTQNFGDTRRAVSFYDITTLTGTVFSQTPLFSIWSGFEDAASTNFEDPGAITVNPKNGTVYMLAFDSGNPGVYDGNADDHDGDYDLYRFNYNAVYNHWVTNGMVSNSMYAPTTGPDGSLNPQHPQHVGTTINLASASEKIGELQRNEDTASTEPFFDYAIEYVNPATMVVLDNQWGRDLTTGEPTGAGFDVPANDHEIYAFNRVSTAPGGATPNYTTQEGGNNAGTTQSWESVVLGPVASDFDLGGNVIGRSEPVDIAYANRDGVQGVWLIEADGGGDDIRFFEITDFNGGPGNGYRELAIDPTNTDHPTTTALDDDPTVSTTTNDGVGDWIRADKNGNLMIGESGFFDVPQGEPKIITREILDYDQADTDGSGFNEIDPGAWDVLAALAPSLDDDGAVTDGRFVAYDRANNRAFWFDIDSGGLPDVVADVYVQDLTTGAIVYEELNAVNHFLERQAIEIFLRGDLNGDGLVDLNDIDPYSADIRDGISLLDQEDTDLTGDWTLTAADLAEIVEGVVGTKLGDFNLDGEVNALDLSTLAGNWQGTGLVYSQGDVNADGVVNALDLSTLAGNWQFSASGQGVSFSEALASVGLGGIPEPSSMVLLGAGGLLLIKRRRRA